MLQAKEGAKGSDSHKEEKQQRTSYHCITSPFSGIHSSRVRQCWRYNIVEFGVGRNPWKGVYILKYVWTTPPKLSSHWTYVYVERFCGHHIISSIPRPHTPAKPCFCPCLILFFNRRHNFRGSLFPLLLPAPIIHSIDSVLLDFGFDYYRQLHCHCSSRRRRIKYIIPESTISLPYCSVLEY